MRHLPGGSDGLRPCYPSPSLGPARNADAVLGRLGEGEEAARPSGLSGQAQGVCASGIRVCVLGEGAGQAVRSVAGLGGRQHKVGGRSHGNPESGAGRGGSVSPYGGVGGWGHHLLSRATPRFLFFFFNFY